MFVRVASFVGGDEDRLQELNEEAARTGTLDLPAGLRRAMLLSAPDGGGHLFLTFFDTREEIAAAEARFESMGDEIPEEVRGRRTSVDVYEVTWDQATET